MLEIWISICVIVFPDFSFILFLEHKIPTENFHRLTSAHIAELCPAIGERFILEDAFKIFAPVEHASGLHLVDSEEVSEAKVIS